jgi:hypothetical protein
MNARKIDIYNHVMLRAIADLLADGAELRGDPKGPLFGPRHRQAHAHGAVASERLCDDRPSHGRGRHRDQAWKPQFPGDGDHGISQERRHSRKGGGYGKSRVDAHDTALRSPAR